MIVHLLLALTILLFALRYSPPQTGGNPTEGDVCAQTFPHAGPDVLAYCRNLRETYRCDQPNEATAAHRRRCRTRTVYDRQGNAHETLVEAAAFGGPTYLGTATCDAAFARLTQADRNYCNQRYASVTYTLKTPVVYSRQTRSRIQQFMVDRYQALHVQLTYAYERVHEDVELPLVRSLSALVPRMVVESLKQQNRITSATGNSVKVKQGGLSDLDVTLDATDCVYRGYDTSVYEVQSCLDRTQGTCVWSDAPTDADVKFYTQVKERNLTVEE